MAPHGPVGTLELQILGDATAVMLAVIIPVIVLTLAFAWWFRVGNARARYLPNWEYSGSIEMITWSIPALLIIVLGAMAWIGSHDLAPERELASDDAPLDVEVVSLDWKWLFIYPKEGVASVNQLVIPAGKPVRFSLTSASVMNSFFIPQLGSQIYTMAGMTTHLNLKADEPGTYDGLSAQFSGDGFSDMRFSVEALSPGQYADWIHGVQGRGGTLDEAAYTEIARPSENVSATSFGRVSSGLFETISQHPVDAVSSDK